jgi:hypothetical protein
MPQTSGPITGETFTDAEWRETVGDEPGILSDVDGTSYTLTLPTSSDVATVGSASQDSMAIVGGFRHKIPLGQTEGITIPAASSATRTDLIGLQYDPTWGAAAPGPVRLHRVAGTEGAGQPTYDAAHPGVEFMPLWSVTRAVGQSLNQATTKDLRVRTGRNLHVPTATALPTSVPLATRAYVKSAGLEYLRTLNDQNTPVWVRTAYTGERSWNVSRATANVTDEYTGTGTILTFTLPSTAPAGSYLIAARVQLAHKTGSSVGTIRMAFGADDYDECRADITTLTQTFTPTFQMTHGGGAAQVVITHKVNTGTAVIANAGTNLAVFYIG